MSENPRLLPGESNTSQGWLQVLVLFGAIVILFMILVTNVSAPTNAPVMADKNFSAYFIEPADGATVPSTFTVRMAVDGLTVEPTGEIHDDAGHLHILIDQDFVAPGDIIPINTAHYLHFGQGQAEAELTLEPGIHILRLQFADGAHQALEGDAYQDEITITVE